MSATAKVSVLLLTYNSAATITSVLSALRRQSSNEFELIVRDNKSSDNTQELLDQLGVEYDAGFSNVGYAVGMNLLLARAQGELVVFLNADCVLHDDFIARAIELFEAW